MKTFKFYTLGCKVNQYETQLMREQLLQYGMEEVNAGSAADLHIVNTCTVTSHADRESRRSIHNAIRKSPQANIIATGCYIEKDTDAVRSIDKNIIIIPNKDKEHIIKYLNNLSPITYHLSPKYITHFKDHTKAFIKIQDGCDNFCSYCKVPYVRGTPKSRNKNEIVKEAKELIKNNYRELVLTGICLGAYGKDLDTGSSLEDILTAITDLDGDFRVRLSSIEMQYVTNSLINVIKDNNKICNHLHIPLQSGDDEILKRMNRNYSTAEFVRKVEKIKEAIPGIAISTDVIIGFPGEDDNAFKNTLSCIRKIQPMRAHIFSYNKREGTAAFGLKHHVSRDKVTQRYITLKKLTDNLAQFYADRSNKIPQRILVENTLVKKSKKLCGYTDTFVKVAFDGPDEWTGKFTYLPPK